MLFLRVYWLFRGSELGKRQRGESSLRKLLQSTAMTSIIGKRVLLAILVHLCYYDVLSINEDGVALLAFKTAILEDPLNALSNWNDSDETPCAWNGVSCMDIGAGNGENRVVGLSIPKQRLLGIIPSVLGTLVYLRHVNLRHNMLNGSLPKEIFAAQGLQSLVLYGNSLTGPLPEEVGQLKNLQILDLSENAFVGTIPPSMKRCTKLRRLVLYKNNFSGAIPRGLGNSLSMLQQLDLSHNMLSGYIPADLGNLSHLQGTLALSNNFLSGPIPASLGDLPEKVSIDLTYNNLTGMIPQDGALVNQGPTAFVGNPGLCGPPLRKPCVVPPTSSGIPNPPNSSHPQLAPSTQILTTSKGLSTGAIVAIAVGDAVGIALMSLIFVYCYWKVISCRRGDSGKEDFSGTEREQVGGRGCCYCCMRMDGSEAYSENVEQLDLVALDSDVGFDLDELLRASAFVLGKNGVGIVYKVVLEDGLTLAVRRLGEGGAQRYKEFQAEVEAIGRIRHPNMLALRAYYWSVDEKLLIYDYIPSGNLASALHGRAASCTPLLWAARLKIAKGIAKGLAYLHEFSPKKYVHGDLKPSNILLGLNMEPYIADFGLGRLANIAGSLSTRQHGTIGTACPESKQLLETRPCSVVAVGLAAQGVLMSPGCPYQAPEVPKIVKPTQKWDVYSFGVILLELLSGKCAIVQVASSEMDLVRWVQICIEEKKPLPDVLDPVLVEELHREEEILGVLKIALACVQGCPDRRPSMKHVAELLEKISGPL